jgi:transposase
MRLHANAALSWSGRRLLAERVLVDRWTLTAAAEAAGVSVRCARKWVGRYRCDGDRGLVDRSSAPRRVANRTPEDRVAVIVALRRLRMTAAEIAETLAMPLSTVSAVLKRHGMGRLGRIGLEQPVRYERSLPGELVHVDVKKLGRIQGGAGKRVSGGGLNHYQPTFRDRDGHRRNSVGWEYVHIAIDDHSRLAYAEVLPERKGGHRDQLPAPRGRVLSPLRHPGPEHPHRQRLRLPRHPPRTRLQNARHPTPPHTPAAATDQRQSRTLHPNHAQRLGLRSHLRLKHRTHHHP